MSQRPYELKGTEFIFDSARWPYVALHNNNINSLEQFYFAVQHCAACISPKTIVGRHVGALIEEFLPGPRFGKTIEAVQQEFKKYLEESPDMRAVA